jgi:hypothetical protein
VAHSTTNMSRARSLSFSVPYETPELLPLVKRPRSQSESNILLPEGPAKFITCTYQMLSDPRFTHLIHWDSEGRSFSIMDEDALAREVLPVFFKHSNIASFVRQLHTYGFRKLPKVAKSKVSSFEHDKFQRGRPDLLLEISRRASDALSRQKGQIQTLQGQIDELRRQNARLSEDHGRLSMLVRQLAEVVSTQSGGESIEAKSVLAELEYECDRAEEVDWSVEEDYVLGEGGEGLGGFPAGFWSDVSPLSHHRTH